MDEDFWEDLKRKEKQEQFWKKPIEEELEKTVEEINQSIRDESSPK